MRRSFPKNLATTYNFVNRMNQSPTKIVTGCSSVPKQIGFKNYFDELDALEVLLLAAGSPNPKTLKKWRSSCEDRVQFSVATPAFDFSKETDFCKSKEAKTLIESVSQLRAKSVLFTNTANFSPSASNRESLLAFFKNIKSKLPDDTCVFWFPKGLWSLAMGLEAVKDSPVYIGFDPLANDALGENVDTHRALFGQRFLYLRIEQTGHKKNRFDNHELEAMAQNLAHTEKAWAIFDHHGAFADSKIFKKIVCTDNNEE